MLVLSFAPSVTPEMVMSVLLVLKLAAHKVNTSTLQLEPAITADTHVQHAQACLLSVQHAHLPSLSETEFASVTPAVLQEATSRPQDVQDVLLSAPHALTPTLVLHALQVTLTLVLTVYRLPHL